MAKQGVYVKGLRETIRTLEKLGVDLNELKDVMANVSSTAAEIMQGFVPVQSGKLRASVRGNRAKGKAVVTVGRARVPYAGPINYGWASRNIAPANFVKKTDEVMDDKALEMLDEGVQDLIKKYGLD
jgi:hypothetical protein